MKPTNLMDAYPTSSLAAVSVVGLIIDSRIEPSSLYCDHAPV